MFIEAEDFLNYDQIHFFIFESEKPPKSDNIERMDNKYKATKMNEIF